MQNLIQLRGVLVVVATAACSTGTPDAAPDPGAGGSTALPIPSGIEYNRIDGASLATMATFSLWINGTVHTR